jgi:hypothetical protein
MTYEESKLQLTGGSWHEIDREVDRIQTAMNHKNPIYAAMHIISQLHTKLLVAESQRDEWQKILAGRSHRDIASTGHSASDFRAPSGLEYRRTRNRATAHSRKQIVMTDSASPVNSQWAAIIADVAQSPNKDILIETTDPQFDEQVCKRHLRRARSLGHPRRSWPPGPTQRNHQPRPSPAWTACRRQPDGSGAVAPPTSKPPPTRRRATSTQARDRLPLPRRCALVAAKLLRKWRAAHPHSSSSPCCRSSRAKRWSSASSSRQARPKQNDNGDPEVQFQERALRTRRNRQRRRRTRNQRLLGSRNRDRTTALGPCTGLEHHFPRCSDYAAGSK